MNIEQLRKSGYIIFECISGSHAYGTATEKSDTDVRGVFVLPTEEVLAGRYISQVSDEKNDITFYEIGKFLELAAKGNPNIMELLNIPRDCIINETVKWTEYFPEEVKDKFLTTKLRHTFSGYAYSQLKRAKGLNKMINWEENKVARKDPLDFVYVLGDREESIPFKHWMKSNTYVQDNLGLAKVNNMPELYAMYFMVEGGIIDKNSNSLQLRSIPKSAPFIGHIRWNKDGYSQHCKDYKTYQTWLKERNEARYEDTLAHGQNIDGKNMLHTVRLLNMAKDIADGKGIVVRRPEAKELLDIRKGKVSLQNLLDKSEEMIEGINSSFDNSGLPREVPAKFRQDLLLRIRMENFKNTKGI